MTQDRAPVSRHDRKKNTASKPSPDYKAPSTTVSAQPPSRTSSGQNVLTDSIFSGRILAEESNDAVLLLKEVCADLKIRGCLECEIAVDLVLNLLRKRRLDKSLALELRKAHVQLSIDEMEDYDCHGFQSPTHDPQSSAGRHEGSHPSFRPMLLEHLERKINENGPDLEKDLTFLNVIFGDRRTRFRAAVVAAYYAMAEDKCGKGDNRAKKEILQAVHNAIRAENARMDLENLLDQIEDQPSTTVLPKEPIFEHLMESMAANDREYRRLLEHLVLIRRLKGRADE